MPSFVFHRNFWATSDTNAAPIRITRGGYPMWQSAVIFTCGFGFQGLSIWWAVFTDWLVWTRTMLGFWWHTSRSRRQEVERTMTTLQTLTAARRPLLLRTVGALGRFDDEQRAALARTMDALDHAAFPVAKQAVRATAVTLGFNRPEAWVNLSRRIRASQPEAENMYRHMHACVLVRDTALPSTLSNPELNLVTELAYQGFAARVR